MQISFHTQGFSAATYRPQGDTKAAQAQVEKPSLSVFEN